MEDELLLDDELLLGDELLLEDELLCFSEELFELDFEELPPDDDFEDDCELPPLLWLDCEYCLLFDDPEAEDCLSD